jgi:hypothetical protein
MVLRLGQGSAISPGRISDYPKLKVEVADCGVALPLARGSPFTAPAENDRHSAICGVCAKQHRYCNALMRVPELFREVSGMVLALYLGCA